MSNRLATKPSRVGDLDRTKWRIDPARSTVEFRTRTFWGVVTVKGKFERYDGTLDLEREPAIDLTIEADSLDTNNKTRDKHLRAADFFDVENHPQVRFVSDSTTLSGERLNARGRLYAAGHSIPLDVEASVQRVDGELQVDSRTYADYYKLGMSRGALGMIRTPSELIVQARLVQDVGDEIEDAQ